MTNTKLSRSELKRMLVNFGIELVIYAVLVTVYFLLVLRLLADPLKILFDDNLPVYAVVALVLIVAQAVLLDYVTSALLKRFGFTRFE